MQRAACLRQNSMVPTMPKIIPILAEFIQSVRIESVDSFHTCLRHLLFCDVAFSDFKKNRNETMKFLQRYLRTFSQFLGYNSWSFSL